jgi:MYXO-CTERM domain-containing protein
MTLDGAAAGTSDRYGYYEREVAPGTHVLGAAAAGFEPGSATCEVGAHQSVECLVPVFLPGEGEPGADAGPAAPRLETYQAGCGCGLGERGARGSGALWGALGLLLLWRRRRGTIKSRSA